MPPATSVSPPRQSPRPALSVAFILCPHFTILPFAAIVDALRLAADEGDGSRPVNCTWTVLGPDRRPVRASCGVEVTPWESFGPPGSLDPDRFDYVIVVGGLLHRGDGLDDTSLGFLREAAEKGVALAGLCTGSFALVRAGVMAGHKCCVSWFHYQDFLDAFADVTPVADQLFVVDGKRITCAGGAVALDLAAFLIDRHLGPARAQKTLHIMVVDKARPPHAAQPQPPTDRPARDERVRRAMLLMEQHLSEPLDAAEIASRVGLSRRQLERLFADEVGLGVQEFARTLRLHYGLWLMANTDRTITAIAEECGFADTSHFNRTFREAFQCTPSAMRGAGPAAMLPILERGAWASAVGEAVRRHASGYLPGEKRPYARGGRAP